MQTIFLFWAIHIVIVWYLKNFVHTPEYGYVSMTNIYLLLTVLFFVLWRALSSHNANGPMVIEWLILCNAFLLHCYGQFAQLRHTKRHDDTKSIVPRIVPRITGRRDILSTMFFSYVFFVLCLLPFAPPWFCNESGAMCGGADKPSTGPLFWSFVSVCARSITIELVLECTAERAV